MQMYPNLLFDGQCEAAFQYYEECLRGTTVFMMRYENTPMDFQTPSEWQKKISHATFAVDSFMLAGSDALPERYQKPQGFAIQLNLSDSSEAERIFHMLGQNGIVQMALEKTFWALRFAVLVDQFGIPWVINCENPPDHSTSPPSAE